MADHLGSQDAHGGLAACAHARPRWTGDDFRAHEKQFDWGLGMRLEIPLSDWWRRSGDGSDGLETIPLLVWFQNFYAHHRAVV